MPSSGLFRDAPSGHSAREQARLAHERFLLDTHAERKAAETSAVTQLARRLRRLLASGGR